MEHCRTAYRITKCNTPTPTHTDAKHRSSQTQHASQNVHMLYTLVVWSSSVLLSRAHTSAHDQMRPSDKHANHGSSLRSIVVHEKRAASPVSPPKCQSQQHMSSGGHE
mmetsp:Transcript_27979/g.76350  ORF Transcript_27979/g.76350 Transcript_27979/m.76350 type:complete len:108 (+) Transcript_27979:125-448(+)|eukprot:scaffold237666_cov33-Tisochrysis_lutea.AAC.3